MIKDFKNILSSTKLAFGLTWRTKNGKKLFLLKAITATFNALSPIILVIMPGMIINELTGDQRNQVLMLYVGILVVTPLVNALIRWLINRTSIRWSYSFSLVCEKQFFDHLSRMDYETLEKPDIQELSDRARNAYTDIDGAIGSVFGFFSSILGLIAITAVIATLNIFIIVLISCIILINSVITSKMKKIVFSYRKQEGRLGAKAHFSARHLIDPALAKESRLYNISQFLIDLFAANRLASYNLTSKRLGMFEKPQVFQAFTGMIQSAIVYAYLIYSVVANGLAIGYLAIFLAATGQFTNAFKGITNALLELQNQSFEINEMQEFLEMPLIQYNSGDISPVFEKKSEIRFENVSFKYPGSENYALKNVNITLRGDEKLCIVGHNGSGKSTFIKLLTRLYMPTEGTIYLNGKNIMEYKYTEYQRLFATVFQEAALFTLPLGQNISLDHDYDSVRMDEVCEKCGLTELVKKLPKGYDTMMDKHVDPEGVIPSGGEKQRIMMARAIYHGAPMYLLDEPTAALDPLMEYEIYTQFSNMINDSAAVLITHRLSAVKLVDKVAVFEEGKLIEYGTHDELFANRGAYHEMYEKQAHFYIK